MRLSFSYRPQSGSRSTAQARLNSVCVFAMPPEVIGAAQMRSSAPALCRMLTAAKTSTASLRLKRMWTMPVRLASAFAPMEQTMAVVTQSPR